jgi:hypothetical protein
MRRNMKNYKELFEKEFDTSQQIDETFAKICNEKGLKKGVEYLKSINCKWLDYDSYTILYTINEWTKKTTSKEEKNNLLERISRQEDGIEVKKEINDNLKVPQLIIKRKDFEIKVIQFSKLVPKAMELFPDLEDDSRKGSCFNKAYGIALKLGIENDIVTGYCYGYTDKSKFLHSWIETKLKGEEVVIDGTLNAVFNKDGFYKLRHIEPLTRISNETLESDIEKYLSNFGTISPEVYYVFRDEMIKDFERNSKTFER